MDLSITHTTQYAFDQPVVYALQKVRLRPLSSSLQDVSEWIVDVDGGQIEASYRDHYGNHVDLVSAHPGAEKLVLTARGHATTQNAAGVLGAVYGAAPLWHFAQPTIATTAGPAIQELAANLAGNPKPLDGLHALSAAILARVPYEFGHTGTDTTAEDAMSIGKGVCQDHANIFVAAARAAGLPARYVSGYLFMPDRTEQDASHGWAEAHVDGLGWVGFDVSNGMSPDDKYLRIAVGRDASDAAPISGLRIGSGDESMIVTLQVQQ